MLLDYTSLYHKLLTCLTSDNLVCTYSMLTSHFWLSIAQYTQNYILINKGLVSTSNDSDIIRFYQNFKRNVSLVDIVTNHKNIM